MSGSSSIMTWSASLAALLEGCLILEVVGTLGSSLISPFFLRPPRVTLLTVSS